MKPNITLIIIIVAFIISICGFMVSMFLPQNNISDALMIAALFIAAGSGVIASVFTNKLTKSKQWNYVIAGGVIMFLSFLLKISGFEFVHQIFFVCGSVFTITALGYYIYINKVDFKYSMWICFFPVILIGCIFKYMYWTGANIIIFGSLFILSLMTIVQLIQLKKHSLLKTMLLVWQLTMCIFITVFHFRHIKLDSIMIAYIFLLVGLVNIFLQQEKNTLENSEFR